MTRTLSFAAFLALGLVGSGCMTERPPVFADALWQVDCDSEMGMCSPSMARMLSGENAMDGNAVQCNVVETADARTVSFYVRNMAAGTPFEARLSNARFPRAGGAPGGGCSFTVGEGANRFTGACGGAAISVEQPCQGRADFGFSAEFGSPTVEVTMLCDHLPNETTSEQLRSLHLPTSPTMPASFLFYDCVGLSSM